MGEAKDNAGVIRLRNATVLAVTVERPGAMELRLQPDGGEAPIDAIAYPQLVGPVAEGDRVVSNAVALELGLGTGGADIVVAVLREGEVHAASEGRIVKLRYTPHQVNVVAAEEAGSPHRAEMEAATTLAGTPVAWAPLHSMVGTVAAGARVAGADRVVYVMTDGAALSAGLSRLVDALRRSELLDAVVTTGQAFGGDLEAVSVFSGLLAARAVAGADVIVVGDGPGNTGTGTTWGASDVSSAMSLNAAAILEGRPVAALRISFADPRERHRGVSHHVLTALARVAMTSVHVAVPVIQDEARRSEVWDALISEGLHVRHQMVEANGRPALDLLADRGVDVTSMGRSVDDDPEFFLAAGAAGVLAGRMATASKLWQGSATEP
jgi:hypothetical protein